MLRTVCVVGMPTYDYDVVRCLLNVSHQIRIRLNSALLATVGEKGSNIRPTRF